MTLIFASRPANLIQTNQKLIEFNMFKIYFDWSNNFYQQMNDQLKRIRQKDYSSIDQKLFQNMTRAENLNSTLSHLSQFQKFLMDQISNLNQPSKLAASSTIAHNISKNFDTLRESLVKCSRVIGQNDRKSIANLKKTLTSLQYLVRDLKNDIYQQVKVTCKQVQDQAKTAMERLIVAWTKQKSLKEEYSARCKALEEEKAKLLTQVQQLKQISQKSIKRQQIQQQMNLTEYSKDGLNLKSSVINMEKVITQFNVQAHSSSTPLRQQPLNQMTPYPYEDRSWKITKQGVHSEQRKSSVSRQNSNHRLCSKSNINILKQNELLLKKGVKQQRGKSRQKLKLVSMM